LRALPERTRPGPRETTAGDGLNLAAANSMQRTHSALYCFSRSYPAPRSRQFIPAGRIFDLAQTLSPLKRFLSIRDYEAETKDATKHCLWEPRDRASRPSLEIRRTNGNARFHQRFRSKKTFCVRRRGNSPAKRVYQTPVFAIDAQGSAGSSGAPCCNNSIEILSGVRIKAMWPSRGGRLMVTPAA
jgi:hypothetical protein